MLKDKNRNESKNDQGKKPEVHISVTNLELEIEEGKVFKDSFVIQSRNQVPMKGKVVSTNDKVGIENPGISGLKKEIVYYFKGKLSLADTEYWGDLVILTDGGEFNIPYHIKVLPRMAQTSIGRIASLEDFAVLYREHPGEAAELFFHSGFSEVFFKNDPRNREIYHSLMKGRNRPLILDEFMTAAGLTEPVSLIPEENSLQLTRDETREKIHLKLSGPGYLEGRISSRMNQLKLTPDTFTSRDFKDGLLEITVERKARPHAGNDMIRIRTVRQELLIPVEWWETESPRKKEAENKRRLKELQAELMHNYLYFRTGSIGFEDFAQEAHRILDDLIFLTGAGSCPDSAAGEPEDRASDNMSQSITYGTREDMVWKLYLLHLLLMEKNTDQAEELMEEILAYEKEHPFKPLPSRYLLYLKAMLHRTPDTIGEAVTSIRSFYENSEYKAQALWMLIYLDREYVYNKRLQYDTIKQLFAAGNNSCLLFFEACDILNDNPGYMEEAGSFEIAVFRWGVRYGFVSMALAYQFVNLALKLKYYSRPIFSVAESLYKVEPEEAFLQVICSLLIKGNKFQKEYHAYFDQAVRANLKIIGLNEFFIRSMDFGIYEKIPQRVLIYFTYSNSLDYVEKAYLYTNILKNKEAYEEVYGAYHSKMLPFVEEQLLKGRINEHLAFLYRHFQKELLENPNHVKAVCDVLFYRRIRCSNPNMTGVYVVSPETGEENYYPLSQGSCMAQLVSRNPLIFFADSEEQRYATGIAYELDSFLSLSQFPEEWVSRNLSNRKILQNRSDLSGASVSLKDLPVLSMIAFNEDYKPYMRAWALEEILRYYESHQDKKKLTRWLEKTAYTDIAPSFRKQLMDFYMEVGMLENAFFGIELYGAHILGAAKQLKLASFGVRYYDRKRDETTLSLVYSAFIRKKYNRDTLAYLMEYFDGELFDLILIWERGVKMKVPVTDFERKILSQSMFTGSHSEGLYKIFASFYQNAETDPLIDSYLSYLSDLELSRGVKLSEDIHIIIGQEILKGRIPDKRARVHFLYYFADKPKLHEKIRDTLETVIGDFIAEEFYLPVFKSYSDQISFPVDYCERTFVTYHGGSGRTVRIYYRIEGEEEETMEQGLLEVLPGMYVTSMHFYESDHVNYRLEVDGEPVPNEEDILFETFEDDGDDSRFFELNRLTRDADEDGRLKEYLIKAYFADEFMTLL